jgi:hypothetical protein
MCFYPWQGIFMVTSRDEGRGLVKVCWADIRSRVAQVEPRFASIVDELSPDKTFPIYLAYRPYGAIVGDTSDLYLPDSKGGSYPLSDPSVPKDIIKNLSYGKNSSPLGMVLEKNIEIFVDLKSEEIAIPWTVNKPGSFISFARNLSRNSSRIYMPNGVLTATSGIRSAFMLPNIGCITHHSRLQRDFNIQTPPPKSMYNHWNLFTELVDNQQEKDWHSCIMYLSEKWVDKLHNDKAWLMLKAYMHEFTWHHFEYERNRAYYDIAFSMIQKKRNLRPNPYLADTAQHLFKIALGAAPGYTPAFSNDSLPLNILQKIFVSSYGLKKYIPTIMQPALFNFEQDKLPIYYSLQHPTTHVFSPKSRKVSSTLFEMRELEHILRIFSEELAKNDAMCSDTILNEIAANIEFKYFHNEADRHNIIKPSSEIADFDKRFVTSKKDTRSQGAKFASDAKFIRGCVSIKAKAV